MHETPLFDAGVGPNLHEQLAVKLEVFVLARGSQARAVTGTLMYNDAAVVEVEGAFRALLYGPSRNIRKLDPNEKTRALTGRSDGG